MTIRKSNHEEKQTKRRRENKDQEEKQTKRRRENKDQEEVTE